MWGLLEWAVQDFNSFGMTLNTKTMEHRHGTWFSEPPTCLVPALNMRLLKWPPLHIPPTATDTSAKVVGSKWGERKERAEQAAGDRTQILQLPSQNHFLFILQIVLSMIRGKLGEFYFRRFPWMFNIPIIKTVRNKTLKQRIFVIPLL